MTHDFPWPRPSGGGPAPEWDGTSFRMDGRAASVLDDPGYLESASRAAEFIRTDLYDQSQKALVRNFRGGKGTGIHGASIARNVARCALHTPRRMPLQPARRAMRRSGAVLLRPHARRFPRHRRRCPTGSRGWLRRQSTCSRPARSGLFATPARREAPPTLRPAHRARRSSGWRWISSRRVSKSSMFELWATSRK